MKKHIFFSFITLFFCLSDLYGQYADPYISVVASPAVISLNATGVLTVIAGNAGNDNLLVNTVEIQIVAGSNAEIVGLHPNFSNDSRWVIDWGMSTIGAGNTLMLRNSGGGFGSFDAGVMNLAVVGRVPSEPVVVSGTISYIPGNNPDLGGLPNSSQGDATTLDNYSQSSVSVSYGLEDCANTTDDDADGFIDCADGDCSIAGVDGTPVLSVSPLSASICGGDSVLMISAITNLSPSHPYIWYDWYGIPSLLENYPNAYAHETGEYALAVGNVFGCIWHSDTITVTVTDIDPTVTQTNSTLTAAMPDAEYQWIDCNTAASPIAGATGQVFNPTQNGSYAVVVSKNGCSETSNCSVVYISSTSSIDIEKENGVTIYPNPFADELYLTFEKEQTDTKVNIFGMDGKLVLSNTVSGSKAVIETQHLPKGMCFVQLIGANEATVFKMIKY